MYCMWFTCRWIMPIHTQRLAFVAMCVCVCFPQKIRPSHNGFPFQGDMFQTIEVLE